MVTILNSLFAIFLSIVLITPIVLLIILLNKDKTPKGTDPSVIKKLEDMDTTIANDTNNALDQVSAKLEDIFTRIEALEEQSNITKVKGFKNEKK
jgi:uncharacterized membrane protein YfhO